MRKESISNIVIEETSSQLLRTLRGRFNHHDAEDLAQEAIWRWSQGHSEIGNPKAWTTRAANNLGASLLRRKMREGRHRESYARRMASRNFATDPVAELILRERDQIIDEALAHLDESERRLIILQQRFTYQELATIFELTHGAIKGWLTRVREKLRQYFSSRFGEPL